MPAWIPAAISGGMSLLGSIFGSGAQKGMNRAEMAWNEKMYGIQRRDALADWNMQNEYNSPSSQMARFRDANLNPNLVYGSGSAAAGTAGEPRSSSTGNWNPRVAPIDIGGAANSALAAFYDVQLKEAQVDNLKTNNTVLLMDGLNKLADLDTKSQNLKKSKLDFSLQSELYATTIEAAKANLASTQASTKATLDANDRAAAMQANTLQEGVERILTSRLNRSKTDLEKSMLRQQIDNAKKDGRLKELDIELRKSQVVPGSPWWMNLLNKYLGSVGAEGTISLPGFKFKGVPDGYNLDSLNRKFMPNYKK